jgi:hypothetical protein
MSGHFIIGVHVRERTEHIPSVQQILTEFGCYIRTRIGLHQTHEGVCSPNGLILLDVVCNDGACRQLVEKLSAVPGVEVRTMEFPLD